MSSTGGQLGEWRVVAFDDCVIKAPPRRPSVQQNAYLLQGLLPVVDQGATFVAGYSNDESLAYKAEELPLIVFGDHTRVLKFVDFPFATGADGTKLIAVDGRKIDPRYFYYALRNISIPSRGYNRHFSLLREAQLVVPSDLNEQRAIASLLATIDEAIAIELRRIGSLSDLRVAAIQRLFGGASLGSRHPSQAEYSSHVVEIPIGALGEVVTGTTPATRIRTYYGGGIPFIAPGDIGESKSVSATEKSLSSEGLAVARSVPSRSVTVVCIGSTVGKVAMTTAAASATNQQINTIVPGADFVPEYVYYLMFRNADLVRSHSSPSPVPIISKGAFERIIVTVTKDRAEQERIVAFLSTIDDRLETARARARTLGDLFQAALARIMTRQLSAAPLLEHEPNTHA